jgi:hypothetical protein
VWYSSDIRKEGRNCLEFFTVRRNGAGIPAKISSGGWRSGISFLILYIPARPVTDINASNPETTRKSRLLPVLTAAKPIRSVTRT